jgi:hypothetical protein
MRLSVESNIEQNRRVMQQGLTQHVNSQLTLREADMLADAILSTQTAEHVVMWTTDNGRPMHTNLVAPL